MHLATGDVVGASLFIAFGLWWLLLPRSVVRFYAWLHRGKVRGPRIPAVRVLGALWIVVMILMEWGALRRLHVGP
jgi:succinate-acetate transporter protein